MDPSFCQRANLSFKIADRRSLIIIHNSLAFNNSNVIVGDFQDLAIDILAALKINAVSPLI